MKTLTAIPISELVKKAGNKRRLSKIAGIQNLGSLSHESVLIDGRMYRPSISTADWAKVNRELVETPKQQPPPAVDALVDALEGLLPFVTSDSVECRGDKCREFWCLSCWDEETVHEAVKNMRAAIAKSRAALVSHRKQGVTHER